MAKIQIGYAVFVGQSGFSGCFLLILIFITVFIRWI